MKKRICAIAVVVICLSILASTTLAYFTDIGTARNVIASGGVNITVVEQQLINGSLQPYPNQPIPIMPAKTVSKVVSVRNEQQDSWVRVRYTVTVCDASGKVLDIPAEELNRVICIEPDTGSWTLKDGWWYCNSVLKSGKTSNPLFKEVAFSGPDMKNNYQNCTVLIEVSARAVQYANNGKTVMEALGWPET